MDKLMLSHIDEDLESSEVAALCFLCLDVLNRKRLETVKDGKDLFLRLEEKGLLENHHFLSQLLQAIGRKDLLSLLESNSSQSEESCGPQTDANPVLSDYRVMLYRIHEDVTKENLEKMKYLLGDKLGKGPLESCNTPLDVLAEMERKGWLTKDSLEELHRILMECDKQLAQRVQEYQSGHQPSIQPFGNLDSPSSSSSHFSMDNQRVSDSPEPQHSLSISETQSSCEHRLSNGQGQSLHSDSDPMAEAAALRDQTECYTLTHNPRGLCIIINNERFTGTELKNRPGTQEDEKALRSVFSRLGFEVRVHEDKTADEIREVLKSLGNTDFMKADALVVCVLSHGEMGCVFGTDERGVLIRDITAPFTGGRAPTLAGKPKLFFIQACQGSDYQRGALPCPSTPRLGEGDERSSWQEDARSAPGRSVPWAADVLVGMATVEECKSFRNTSTGSIYIQELCRQLERAAASKEDILTVLTRVNREVSRGEYLKHKQMPEPKYTLTKKLILTFV